MATINFQMQPQRSKTGLSFQGPDESALAGADPFMPPQVATYAQPQVTQTNPLAGGAPAATGTAGDYTGYGQEWLKSQGRTPADLAAFNTAHPGYGATLSGSKGDKVNIGGHIFDAVIAAGLGGQGGSWSDVTNPQPAASGFPMSSYVAQFNDPSTKRLEEYLNQRIAQLQQPAYTGTEQEILRTQALEPIERDRQAARQRALQNVGARGLEPTSGVAQELMNLVDRGYDTQRAGAQNDLAYKQVNERRSRDQEVQQLLSLLYDLPNNALKQALAVMGMGPSPESLFGQTASLYGLQRQNQMVNSQYWNSLGAMLPYLFPNS